LSSLTTNAGGTVSLRNVTTTGAQSYGENATLNGTYTTTNGAFGVTGTTTLAGATVVSTGSGAVTFTGAVDGGQTLAVNSTGVTLFSANVGASTALASLTTDAGGTTAINGGSVTTTGAQTYNDAVTLGANTTITGVGNTFGGTVNGARTLSIIDSGTTTFAGAVGGSTALTSLTTDAGGTTAINGGSVTTTGAQTYNDAVRLLGNMTLASTGTGDVGNITFSSTVDGDTQGGQSLTIQTAGATTFGASVGGADNKALASLVTHSDGRVVIDGGSIRTTGSQTYGNDMMLGANTTLSSLAAGRVVMNGKVNGSYDLMVNTAGATIFNNTIGDTTALVSVTTDAPGSVQVNGGRVTTSGGQTYNENMTLGASTTLISLGAGDIKFARTLDGAYDLIVNTAGKTIFAGVVGGNTPLANVTTDAPGSVILSGGALNVTGSQVLNELIDIHAYKFQLPAGSRLFPSAVASASPQLNLAPIDDVTKSTQLSVGNLNFVNLSVLLPTQSATASSVTQVPESAVDRAVSQILGSEKSKTITYVVIVGGGVRHGEGVMPFFGGQGAGNLPASTGNERENR
jgi:trimeric autotransporter adhesin